MDAGQILNSITGALKQELGDGYDLISSFAERQGRMLAKRAKNCATERANGYLKNDDELFADRLQALEDDAASLAKHIAMLTALTIEKAWNAVVGILWGALRTILSGAGVPAGLLPATPPISM